MPYFVSRQHLYYSDQLMVEIAFPSIDYSSPDMLVEKYKGEGETFDDPREALEVALSILEMWRKDEPEADIGICSGSFELCEGEPEEIEDLKQWAEKEYNSLPKCALCGEILGEEYYTNEDSEFSEEKFCSESHAEKAYENNYDLCFICEKEYPRKDMNSRDNEIFICDECQNLEDSYGSIDIEKLNNDSFVGFSLEDQNIIRYLLNKTYLNEKDLSNLKDMLEKILIDINIIDEDMNTLELIQWG